MYKNLHFQLKVLSSIPVRPKFTLVKSGPLERACAPPSASVSTTPYGVLNTVAKYSFALSFTLVFHSVKNWISNKNGKTRGGPRSPMFREKCLPTSLVMLPAWSIPQNREMGAGHLWSLPLAQCWEGPREGRGYPTDGQGWRKSSLKGHMWNVPWHTGTYLSVKMGRASWWWTPCGRPPEK